MGESIRRATSAFSVVALVYLASCTSSSQDSSGKIRKVTDDFTNGNFASGDLTGWTVTTMLVPSAGMATFPPAKIADLQLTTGGNNFTSIVGSATPGYPVPSGLVAADTLTYPFQGSSYAALVNAQGKNRNANVLTQSMTVTAADVDPADGNVHVRFAIAPVLDNPGHAPNEQPYFFVELDDTTTGTEFFYTYNFANQPGVEWNQLSSSDPSILYTNWQAFDVAPGPAGIGIGDTVTATIVGAGCSLGGHWGELYVDQFGTKFPLPNVNVSAPAFVQASSQLTYTLLAENGGNGAATNAIVTWSTPTMADNSSPPQAVAVAFDSLSAPGASCTSPTAGSSGDVVCNIGSLSPGGSYTFTVTVDVPALSVFTNAAVAPVLVNEGTYNIATDQTSAISGGLVQTQVTSSLPVDLEATLTDGLAALTWGTADTYTFVVTNDGPNVATGVTITDVQPPAFAGTTWICSGSNGGTCGTPTGSGAISNTVNLPIGASVSITVSTTVSGGPAAANVTYQVTATPPAGLVQSRPLHNIGVDSDSASASLDVFTVSKDSAGTGQGLLVSSPTAIRCDINCTTAQASFSNDTFISVSAVAPPGETFTGWSGACTGLVNPCNFTIAANTTLTARFDQPTLTAAIGTTSNAGSLNVRPGDTVDYSVAVTVPENNNAGVTLTDVFPSDLSYVTVTAPTTTGTVTCSVSGGCTAPNVTPGATTTVDFGVVSCTTVGGCLVQFTVRGQITTTAVRGDSVVNVLDVVGTPNQNAPAVTVIEPALAMARSANPAAGLLPGQTSTVTVTLTNDTGGANSGAYNVVVTLPTEADTTAGQYVQGTCPVATPSFAAGAVFTFATGEPSVFPAPSSCTFSYVLTLKGSAPFLSTLTIPAGSATSQSLGGSAPPAKAYSTSDTSFSLQTTGLATGVACTVAADCVVGVCDPADQKCGYANGDGTCTGANAAARCQSGGCSVSLVCEAPGSCLVDGDCAAAQFCNTLTNVCTPKLANGVGVPTLAGHSPALTGVCGAAVGTAVCQSGVCDTSDNLCGFAMGDGTCTVTAQCRSGACVLTGVNTGECEVCAMDSACSGSTPACSSTTNTCVACTATNATACVGAAPVCNVTTNTCSACSAGNQSACTGTTPVCDTTTSACVACGADYGSSSALTCPNTVPVCNTVSGACGPLVVDAGASEAGADASGDAIADVGADASGDAGEGAADAARDAPAADAAPSHKDAAAEAGHAKKDASINDESDGLVVAGGGCSQSPSGAGGAHGLTGVLIALTALLARRRRMAA